MEKKKGKAKNRGRQPRQGVSRTAGVKARTVAKSSAEQQLVVESAQAISGTVNAEIEPYVPPDLIMNYADNLNIVHTQAEFVISFLQMQPPILLVDGAVANKLQTKCVARVVISPARMPSFIEILIKNWQRYADKFLQTENVNVATTEKATESERAE